MTLSGLITIIKLVRKWRTHRQGKKMFKGKLTYTMLGGLVVGLSAKVLGDGVVSEADWQEVVEAVLALVAIYGRWRATRA